MEIYKITSPNEWKFFAKGNANVLFEYTGSNDYLKYRLLRTRLNKKDEQYIGTCELYDFIELKCKPLFHKHLIDVQLVVLNQEFVSSLDSNDNDIVINERYGLLIPNMVYYCDKKYDISNYFQIYLGFKDSDNKSSNLDSSETNSVIFEIKPKWLYDNNTNYCRTCSLKQLRGMKRHFCPLDLLYEETIDRGINDIFSEIPDNIYRNLVETSKIPIKQLFKLYLSKSDNIFLQLKKLQKVPVGTQIKDLNSAEDVSSNLSLVMTLRDVGLLLKFEKYDVNNDIHNSQSNVNNLVKVDQYGKFLITCNIYDLDLKPSSKYKYWIKVEEELQQIYNSSNPNWNYCFKAAGATCSRSDLN